MLFRSGFKIDDSIQKMQSEKLNRLKSKRNPEIVQNCLDQLKKAATSNDNIMPIVIEAVENYCTLGEIAEESAWCDLYTFDSASSVITRASV